MNLLGGFTSKDEEVEATADGMVSKIISSFINADWLQAAEDVVNDILSGFITAWESVVGWFDSAKGGLLSGTDEVRAGWSDLSRWVDNEKSGLLSSIFDVEREMDSTASWVGWQIDSLFSDIEELENAANSISDSISGSGTFTQTGNQNQAQEFMQNQSVNITQNIYGSTGSAADLMEQAVYNQIKATTAVM
jgi:hypothetical protein